MHTIPTMKKHPENYILVRKKIQVAVAEMKVKQEKQRHLEEHQPKEAQHLLEEKHSIL
jgi:hypothetical protein